MIPLLIAGVLWTCPPHGLLRWLLLDAKCILLKLTDQRENLPLKGTTSSSVHGRRFCHLMRAAGKILCVVAAGNHLYVCGGSLGAEYFSKAERFDTVENQWEEIADLHEKKARAFGVATEGKIFLAGGFQVNGMFLGNAMFLRTCEMYNISTNEWQLIGSLNVSRAHGRMVCLKGTLYVLGGTFDAWLDRSDLIVECYDPTEDKWFMKTTIPVKMISKDNNHYFTGCILKLSKGVLDKLDVVKDSKS